MIRMFSLAIRLSANILAGHTLVFIICSFLLSLVLTNKLLAFLFLIPLFAVFFLEFGIAVLQAYVFTVLLCIYLSDSLKTPGH
jgi:F0F1-type ATP synthase membrane subunit a